MERVNPIKVSNPKREKPFQLVELNVKIPAVHIPRIVKFLEGFQYATDDVPVCTFVNLVLRQIEPKLKEEINGSHT